MKQQIRRLVDMGGLVLVKVYDDHLESAYVDGPVSHFYPMAPRPDLKQFVRIARQHGYSDPMRYGLEHDLTHHFIASILGAPYSRVVRSDAIQAMDKIRARDHELPWPWRMDDEEHLVNRLQVFTWMGEPDPYGCLNAVWGDRVQDVADHLKHFLRPSVHPRPDGKIPHALAGVPGFTPEMAERDHFLAAENGA